MKSNKILTRVKFSWYKWGVIILISLFWGYVLWNNWFSPNYFWHFALLSFLMVGSGYIYGIQKFVDMDEFDRQLKMEMANKEKENKK